MRAINVSAGILAVSSLAVWLAACSPPGEQLMDEKQNRAEGTTGCCQRTTTSCTDSVTEAECDGLEGIFQEGKRCRTDTGACAEEQ